MNYAPFLIFLLIIAAMLGESSVFTLFYLLAGAYIVGNWWSRSGIGAVRFKREFTRRAFHGESIPVRLEIENASRLPVVWLRLHESLPVELITPNFIRQVISLGAHGREQFEYTLQANKRGYYRIGPLFLNSGDVFGVAAEQAREGAHDYLTVYPKIVPLTGVALPSHSPLGTLKHTQPIFEDPARVMGKRDYVSGDSLRRVDWKATAASGRLQVKQFEPSIALEALIALDLRDDSYDRRARYDDSELAIVVAASVANYIINQKQPVGLLTNAKDASPPSFPPHSQTPTHSPVLQPSSGASLPAHKSRPHLMRLLEILACAQTSEDAPALTDLLPNQIAALPWGATLILITGQAGDSLLDSLFHARRAGLNAVVILVGHGKGFSAFQQRAARFGFEVYEVAREQDMVSPSTL